ncbi:MAG: hypothetical protein FJX74_25930 [Armatimonadetes bacterium]|nr:hypothetical protein [Armatimonadota bacterium]
MELDVFSGRPNPAWTLTHAESEELAALLQGLAASDPSPAVYEGLGYRGLLVRPLGGPGLRIVRGAVREDLEGGRTWHDPDRHIERLLIEKARAQVTPDLHEWARREAGLD